MLACFEVPEPASLGSDRSVPGRGADDTAPGTRAQPREDVAPDVTNLRAVAIAQWDVRQTPFVTPRAQGLSPDRKSARALDLVDHLGLARSVPHHIDSRDVLAWVAALGACWRPRIVTGSDRCGLLAYDLCLELRPGARGLAAEGGSPATPLDAHACLGMRSARGPRDVLGLVLRSLLARAGVRPKVPTSDDFSRSSGERRGRSRGYSVV